MPKVQIDLTTLSGWANLTTGQHSIQVRAKATNAKTSELSQAVTVEKQASGGYDFANDTWATIAQQIKAGTDHYSLGDTKTDTITVGGTNYSVVFKIVDNVVGRYTTQSGQSHKVIEMQTVVGTSASSGVAYNSDGSGTSFANSTLFSELNSTILNYLPSDLRAVLETTTVYSGNGTQNASQATNVSATGKLFSPCMNEYYGDNETYGYANSSEGTPQYQYYKNLGVTTSNYSALIKQNLNGDNQWYWLRSPCCSGRFDFAVLVYGVGDRGVDGVGDGGLRGVLCFAW